MAFIIMLFFALTSLVGKNYDFGSKNLGNKSASALIGLIYKK